MHWREQEQKLIQYSSWMGISRSSTLFLMMWHAAAGTYHAAITENADDFRGKVIMDVGAGSGILSLFAAQAPPFYFYFYFLFLDVSCFILFHLVLSCFLLFYLFLVYLISS